MKTKNIKSTKEKRKIRKRQRTLLVGAFCGVILLIIFKSHILTLLKMGVFAVAGFLILRLVFVIWKKYSKPSTIRNHNDRSKESFYTDFSEFKGQDEKTDKKSKDKNYNWILDKDTSAKEENNEKINNYSTSIRDDKDEAKEIRSKVAHWMKSVDYSSYIHGKIIKESSKMYNECNVVEGNTNVGEVESYTSNDVIELHDSTNDFQNDEQFNYLDIHSIQKSQHENIIEGDMKFFNSEVESTGDYIYVSSLYEDNKVNSDKDLCKNDINEMDFEPFEDYNNVSNWGTDVVSQNPEENHIYNREKVENNTLDKNNEDSIDIFKHEKEAENFISAIMPSVPFGVGFIEKDVLLGANRRNGESAGDNGFSKNKIILDYKFLKQQRAKEKEEKLKRVIEEGTLNSQYPDNGLKVNEEINSPDNVRSNTQDNVDIKKLTEFVLPSLDILRQPQMKVSGESVGIKTENDAQKLIETLASFGVGAKIINVSQGPSVTRYEIQPDYGVKVSKIVNLSDDIALNLAALGVRIEAPIPGKAAIGIEIPNSEVTPVFLREVLESEKFRNHPSKLAFAVGKDIAGNSVVADIGLMPHLLIAGATGSGKSVCINTLITSILYKANSSEVKLLMVDPKVVELSIYNGIPHLLIPVVTDPKKAAGALSWAVQEMTNRYKLFADNNVRDLKGFNLIMKDQGKDTLPQIVIIIDELADLMMVAPNDVEDCICRLAQMARAAGMHLVIATQRPSVNVITGVIKANVPSRISFAVSSQVDSRTILDMGGAEKLLGKGDMLFSPLGTPKPLRVQGALITDKEVESIVSFLKAKEPVKYNEFIMEEIESQAEVSQSEPENDDELFPQVVDMIIDMEHASTSLIQRKFKVGYARAARILDQLESNGIVGPFEGSKPRKVLITRQQWNEMK